MSKAVPKNANEFIEQQLDERANAVAKAFGSDVLSISGPLIVGVDDVLRATIEGIRQDSKNRSLTVLVTTLGGYIEIVQRMVDTIRFNYRRVVFVVPNSAFSAGTILVMSGDSIYMDYYSRLGPIDPQVETAKGVPVPALGYLIQWERLLKKAGEGKLTEPEVHLMVEGFDQAELYKYEQSRNLSITLLKKWLVQFKFKNWKKTETRKILVTREIREQRAEEIARKLNDTNRWHTHGHGISMEVLRRELKMRIDDFGADPNLNDPIKYYHALLDDYMVKRGARGVIHTPGMYLPFMSSR